MSYSFSMIKKNWPGFNWPLSKKRMTGAEITQELEKRREHRPSPGTIYPVLKYLTEKNLLKVDNDKKYSLTQKGKQELE